METLLIVIGCVLGVVWFVIKHDDSDHPEDE